MATTSSKKKKYHTNLDPGSKCGRTLLTCQITRFLTLFHPLRLFKRNHQHWLKNDFPKIRSSSAWTWSLSFGLASFSRKVWRTIEPDIAILVDSELFQHFNKKTKYSSIIINARLSDCISRLSSPWLKWTHPLIFPPNLSVIAASERQHARWLELSFPSDRVQVSGNMKIDAIDQSQIDNETRINFRRELGFSNDTLVVAGVSTWPGEEKMLIDLVHSLRWRKSISNY